MISPEGLGQFAHKPAMPMDLPSARVILVGITVPDEDVRSRRLMAAMDTLNERYGRGALRVAAEGIRPAWKMKREWLSPGYTTEWARLPVVRAR